LRFIEQNGPCHLSQALEGLAAKLALTPDDLDELLPDGGESAFKNRVGWAKTYLKKAGLLETVGRATYAITASGQELLAEDLPYIDNTVLLRYPDFRVFKLGKKSTLPDSSSLLTEEDSLDPLEAFHQSYLAIQARLKDDLLDTLKQMPAMAFEKLVVDLLVAMGYGGSAEEIRQSTMKGSSDRGIDGVIKEDALGLSHIYVQAKRWSETAVGSPVVHSFVGSLEQFHGRKGVLMTTSRFTQEAKDYIGRIGKAIALIDGEKLVELMLEYEVGVNAENTYTTYTIRPLQALHGNVDVQSLATVGG
jgi:restriction system protein